MQSFPLYTSYLFSMFLNGDIVGIEKLDGVFSFTFVVNFQDYFYIHESFPLNIQDQHK